MRRDIGSIATPSERAAKPAPRAFRARGAGPVRHRRDGAGRVGPGGPSRLQRLRGSAPAAVRTVHSVRVRRTGSLVTIDVAADAFLRQMVRRRGRPPGVGHGRTNEEAVAEALASRRPHSTGTAPAKGLCLKRVVLGPMRARAASASTTARTENDDREDIYGRESEIERRWYVVDATDETLGRLASRIARVLEGKNKRPTAPRSTRRPCRRRERGQDPRHVRQA